MKQSYHMFVIPAAIAWSICAIACSTELQMKENLAVTAGFKVVAPVEPKRLEILAKLPADKLTEADYQGNAYYILPDSKNSQAYVGGFKEYQAYQKLRREMNLRAEEAQKNQAAALDWNWGGASTADGNQR